ncbi:hypothetical protein K402DRAFT_467464 [Aulographum hederae CBS 113979]|uniref:Uncharacterized protein n=1 Tax=Aulographum hederae CBS 113979 TaxID=1176131 RepID=A0A6G1GLD3_9PEZI|nr:hypothetical protein K402DRAFT_467464 [Aulographum hederae CBS 113979]
MIMQHPPTSADFSVEGVYTKLSPNQASLPVLLQQTLTGISEARIHIQLQQLQIQRENHDFRARVPEFQQCIAGIPSESPNEEEEQLLEYIKGEIVKDYKRKEKERNLRVQLERLEKKEHKIRLVLDALIGELLDTIQEIRDERLDPEVVRTEREEELFHTSWQNLDLTSTPTPRSSALSTGQEQSALDKLHHCYQVHHEAEHAFTHHRQHFYQWASSFNPSPLPSDLPRLTRPDFDRLYLIVGSKRSQELTAAEDALYEGPDQGVEGGGCAWRVGNFHVC